MRPVQLTRGKKVQSRRERKIQHNTYLFRRVERDILNAFLQIGERKENIEIIFSYFVMVMMVMMMMVKTEG